MELCVTTNRPRVQHLREDMDALCGADFLYLTRVRMGQKGDGLPLCAKCAEKERLIRLVDGLKPTPKAGG